MAEQVNDQVLRRREELMLLEEAGINPYPYSFDKTHSSIEVREQYSDEAAEKSIIVSIAGRIMAIRRMGKASFIHIADEKGKIQIYLRRDDVPEFYDHFKKIDIGDIIGVKGYVFRTRTGEISVHASEVTLLCKSTLPLPIAKEEIDADGNKIIHDAFADKELRYRKRYLDLIVNPDIKDVFIKRAKIISAIRKMFDDAGYLEVETPILQAIYGGASARPFITHHNALDMPLYMRIADELYLKRLIVGGFEGVYEISKNFRNEGMDKTHNPEFTAMEVYVAYKDYFWMMDTTETMFKNCALAANGSTVIEINGKAIDLAKPFRRAKMFDLYKEYTGKDLFGLSREELLAAAKELHVDVEDDASSMKILDEIFGEKIEAHLIEPTFVMDYPIEMSPLTKKHREVEGLVERFELFINGTEFANCYSELNDPRDQRDRLEKQSIDRAGGDEEAMIMDEDFVNSLEVGMPPTAGLGLGIDRMVMLITGQTSIRDVLFFPHMRPEV